VIQLQKTDGMQVAETESAGLDFASRLVGFLGQILPFVVLLSVALLLITCLTAGTTSPLFSAGILEVLGFTGIWIVSRKRAHRAFSARLYTFVFCFCVIVICLIYLYYLQVFGMPYEMGGTDDARFEWQAEALRISGVTSYVAAQDFLRTIGSGTWNSAGNYVIGLALLSNGTEWWGLGIHTLNPRILNAFLLGITAVLVTSVSRRVSSSEATARLAGYYAGLLPTIVFTAAHVYRDVAIGAGIMAVVVLTIRLTETPSSMVKQGRTLKRGVLLVGILLITASLREDLLVIMVGIVALMLIVQVRSRLYRTALVVLVLVGLGIALLTGWLDNFLERADFLTTYYTEYRAAGGSETGLGTGIYRLPAALSYPLRVAYVSLSPLPIPSGNAAEDYRRLGVVVWFLSLPFLLKALRLTLRRPTERRDFVRRSIAVAFLGFYLAVSIVTLQARQIVMFAPIGAVLVASGIEETQHSVARPIWSMVGLGGLGVVLYIVLRSS